MRLTTLQYETKQQEHYNVDDYIQIFHLLRFIVGYMVGNHVLKRVELNFRLYTRRYTSSNDFFEYSYPLNVWLLRYPELCVDLVSFDLYAVASSLSRHDHNVENKKRRLTDTTLSHK